MKWSKQQIEEHEKNFEIFRKKYLKRESGSSSIRNIQGNKRRCATLVHRIQPANRNELSKISRKLRENIHGFYHQEIPHFTIDCHRYLTENKLPEDINSLSLKEQRRNLIDDWELINYNKILKEIVGKEREYSIELNGIAIGGDGLIVQVWYDDSRLQEFNERLGEKVRAEISSMDFKWGMVKNKVPIRVLNLTRFTGDEDGEEVLKYVDENRHRKIGEFKMKELNFLASDHYIQKKNTLELGKYLFKD